MRIAVTSDVHGNLLAWEAVLADTAAQGVDVTVDLGDPLSGGRCPRETADRLVEPDPPTVRGDHERQVLDTPVERMIRSDRLAHGVLLPKHRAWLAALPSTLDLDGDVLDFHGSPTDDLTHLLDTVEPGGARPATVQEVLTRSGPHAERRVLLCGHTHLQRCLRLPTGALVVNPGSVGWPADDDDAPYPHRHGGRHPHARYAPPAPQR